jgi:uncharacterized protein YjbI with pentapeptide repeats
LDEWAAVTGWLKKHWQGVVGFVLALAVIVTLGWFGWWLIRPDSADARNEYARTVLTAIGAVALLFQLGYTRESTKAATRTQQVTEQGQVTDRFYKAIEQLASAPTDVRMGALFALERIAQDSDRDYEQVMSIIAAYVRQRAKLSAAQFLEPPTSGTPVGEDIQVAMTILGRRTKRFMAGEVTPIDLSETDLTRVRLRDANFNGARFQGCYLDEAEFVGGSFQGTDFSGVVARSAKFERCLLGDADFTYAHLNAAGFTDLQLDPTDEWLRPDVSRVEGMLDGVDFWEAKLHKTRFSVSDLSRCKGVRKVQLDKAWVAPGTPLPQQTIWWNPKVDREDERLVYRHYE